jgi:hypothetical protein
MEMAERDFFNRHETKDILTMQQLFDAVTTFARLPDGGGLYFRGHSDASWELVPTIGRPNFYKHAGHSIEKFELGQEKSLLHRFQRYAYAQTQKILDPWEALFLARHHGLPVRLLDWTTNPLVALYHAVLFTDDPRSDGAIWAFCRIKDDSKDIDVLKEINEKRSPFDILGIRIVYPVYISPRMVAQSGCFTIHHNPRCRLNLDSPTNYPADSFDIFELRKWTIPKSSKAGFLDILERMAINTRTLFPDLDGLAKGLWQLEAIRKK